MFPSASEALIRSFGTRSSWFEMSETNVGKIMIIKMIVPINIEDEFSNPNILVKAVNEESANIPNTTEGTPASTFISNLTPFCPFFILNLIKNEALSAIGNAIRTAIIEVTSVTERAPQIPHPPFSEKSEVKYMWNSP